jgi:chromosome segregation ATPase
MTESAQVHSTEKLQDLHEALARFGVQACAALETAQIEIRRTLDSLEDQLRYWQGEIHSRQEEVNRVRADLSYHRSLHHGEHVGGTDLEHQLRKAQARLREAEDRVQAVRRWQRNLPEFIHDYEAPARQLAGFVESNLLQGLALLEDKIAALAAYLALAAPQSTASGPPSAVAEKSDPPRGQP